ncbi:unnamed protein product [Cochlearia groenlandica]
MALARRFQTFASLLRSSRSIESSSSPFGCWRSYHSSLFHAPEAHGRSMYYNANAHLLRSTTIAESLPFMNDKRFATTQVKAPPQLQKTGAVRVSMVSPGFVYEPYALQEKIPFWRRCLTRSGWRRTKEDFIRELRSAYAIAKLRKTGYSKNKFYIEALELYKEINILLANGDKKTLRKNVTERMYSSLKNEIKQREAIQNGVYWELVEPVIKIKTLQARLIGIDRTDLAKAFIQLTLEFMTKQKYEAYDSKGNVVAGDKNKELLVRDIWVFEKSLFHTGAQWRLCGRIKL